ncbi:MAG: protein kinase [Bacteroidales bacterium]|nr:protein kinase [Bacteroidales bacterium]
MTQEDFFKRYTYTPSRDRIGGGGFGTVYKAKDNVLHREVAIKVSEVKTTADGKKTFSLKDEFEALAHVPKHPNIANYEEFYSYESPQGLFDYAVMQYYPDGNLSNAIKQGLTAEQKEDIATQLLEGIDFLHKHKVVHRDLKPGNILIVKDGSKVIPLITDFGLSKAAGVVDGSVFSNSFGAGTPRYSSPEQLQGNPLRFNTDLWSYGAILYELFTGEQLFTAGSGAANTAQADMEVYNKIVNGNVQSLGKIPEKWRKVAERCLVVDATKRAKDAKELFDFVRGDDDETEGPTRGPVTPPKDTSSPKPPHSGPAPLSPTPNGKPGPKKGLWIGIAAAAVVALLVLLLKPKKEPTPTDPDTQAYEACQTVNDYRAYMRDYGRNALHYADAQQFVKDFVADSTAKVEEDAAYWQCTSVAACESYLQAYPQGRYVAEVKVKKVELESVAYDEDLKKEEAAYRKCTTIEACDSYLAAYPQGRYVAEVRKKRTELKKAQQPQQSLTGTANGHEWVDLGLSSGTLWATCNIGAKNPEDYGNYYAWGETKTKSTYSWKTYKFSNDGSWSNRNLTKYCDESDYGDNGFTDNLTALQPGDDPAATWGSGWHMPTKKQWEELIKNTSNKWTTQNSVKGRLFTSRKNGQTLFLPAAGCSKDYIGSYGVYWSRSLFIGMPDRAWGFDFDSDDCDMGLNDERFLGLSVRPVREK